MSLAVFVLDTVDFHRSAVTHCVLLHGGHHLACRHTDTPVQAAENPNYQELEQLGGNERLGWRARRAPDLLCLCTQLLARMAQAAAPEHAPTRSTPLLLACFAAADSGCSVCSFHTSKERTF